MRRTDRWSFIALGVGIVAIFAGIQVAAMLDDPSPPARTHDFCPDNPAGTARADTRYKETSEPYRGDGPHPVAFHRAHAPDGRVNGLPGQWRAGGAGEDPRPRLVACVYQRNTGTREAVRDCHYTALGLNTRVDPRNTTKVTLVKARYVLRLYEAETAEPVGRIQVPGDRACPSRYDPESGGSLFQEPDTGKLRAALRPYVERSVDA